jgi:hypothetical protein
VLRRGRAKTRAALRKVIDTVMEKDIGTHRALHLKKKKYIER